MGCMQLLGSSGVAPDEKQGNMGSTEVFVTFLLYEDFERPLLEACSLATSSPSFHVMILL